MIEIELRFGCSGRNEWEFINYQKKMLTKNELFLPSEQSLYKSDFSNYNEGKPLNLRVQDNLSLLWSSHVFANHLNKCHLVQNTALYLIDFEVWGIGKTVEKLWLNKRLYQKIKRTLRVWHSSHWNEICSFSIKTEKALRPDDIYVEIVKPVDSENIVILVYFFNTIHRTEVIPQKWLQSTFITIPKKTNDCL